MKGKAQSSLISPLIWVGWGFQNQRMGFYQGTKKLGEERKKIQYNKLTKAQM